MLLLLALLIQFSWADCLDPVQVDEIRQAIAIPMLKVDLCEENQDSHKLLSALSFLKTTPLPPMESSPLSRNLVPTHAWNYFKARVHRLVLEPTCPQGKMASVHPLEPGVMRLCPSFFDSSFSIVERLPTLLHEARHFDGDHFPHVHCAQGRLKGMRNACDLSLSYGGGYAVEAEVLTRLSQVKSLREQLRARARNMALERAAENFNQSVMPYRLEALYLESEDGHGYLLDPELKELIPVRRLDRSQQTIVSRGPTLMTFPYGAGDAQVVDTLSPSLHLLPAQGSIARDFNRQAPSERGSILAIFNDDLFSGHFTPSQMSVALAPNNYETEVDFGFTATEIFTGREMGRDENSFYVRSEQGDLTRVQLSSGRNHEVYPREPFPSGLRSFGFFQGTRVALTEEGAFVRQESGQWKNVPALAGRRFAFISRPFYWAPFLME